MHHFSRPVLTIFNKKLLTVPIMGTIVPNMGTVNKTISLGEALFSKTQRQVLGLLFGTPERSFYLNEIVRIAGVGIGTVQRELEKLACAGLLTVEKIGNQKHYQANHNSPIYDELRGLVVKTFGLADVLRKALEPCLAKISVAFIYGSQAAGTDGASSDIDVMILAEQLSYPELLTAFSGIDSTLGRPERNQWSGSFCKNALARCTQSSAIRRKPI